METLTKDRDIYYNPNNLTDDVKSGMEIYLSDNLKLLKEYLYEDNDYSIVITFATKTGREWTVQTGDNSYTGNCYGLPHWAVTTIHQDTTKEDILNSIYQQFDEIELDEFEG